MVTETQLYALLAIMVAVWGGLLILSGTAVSADLLKPFSTAVGIISVCLVIFDKWAWRLPFLYPWFVSKPNLEGTWKGQILSSWIDPETKAKSPPLDAYLVIRQTFSSIQMRLLSKELNSELLAGNFVREADGIVQIAAVYRGTPKLLIRGRSPIHYGGLILRVLGNVPYALEGEYWTDRDTKGEMRFGERSKIQYHEFESASTGKYERQNSPAPRSST